MNPELLSNPQLCAICLVAGMVSLLTSLGLASRPAAVQTRRVMLAGTVANLFFLVTRFANLLYAPFMAKFVDSAERTHNLDLLHGQMRWVLLGSALGSSASLLLLPTFVELYRQGILSLAHRRTLIGVALRLLLPRTWKKVVRSIRSPGHMGVKPFRLGELPKGFLLINVLASALWSVGILATLSVSAQVPQLAQTAVLLTGFITAFSAISFSLWVDPQAAVVTDQAIAGQRPEHDINVVAVHLALGNAAGGFLGFLLLEPATRIVRFVATLLGTQGQTMAHSTWILICFNVSFALLASTTYVSRISAVRTKRAATAVSVYNLFFLMARLGQQAISPLLGAIGDFYRRNQLPLTQLSAIYRQILLGATIGTLLAWLLMPTLIAVYDKLIENVDRKGTIYAVLLAGANPAKWPKLLSLLRRPSLFGLGKPDFRRIPKPLILGNILVLSIHTVGVVASVYAGCSLPELKRTASLMSAFVNGMATIVLGLAVEPTISVITQETLDGKRPKKDVYALGVLLIASMLIGTLCSQLLLEPARAFVSLAARFFDSLH